MKILVIDLEGTDLELFLSGEKMENLQQLIEMGGYGRLAGHIPSGFRVAVARDLPDFYAWDYLAEAEKKSILIGQPFVLQQGSLNISWITSHFGWEGIDKGIVASHDLSGMLDVTALPLWGEEPGNKSGSIDAFIAASQAQFSIAMDLLSSRTWDYFQLTDMGLTHFNKMSDDWEEGVRSYAASLDYEIGKLLQLLTDEVILLVLFQNAGGENIVINSDGAPHGDAQFILAAANNPLLGDLSDVGWDELFPTLCELAGFPTSRQFSGSSLIASRAAEILARNDLAPDEAEIIRERLSGLGYIS
jgi:predicted AlkP superfamily phosphohydrolase/phosphomutase